jgi:hypothetical protein
MLHIARNERRSGATGLPWRSRACKLGLDFEDRVGRFPDNTGGGIELSTFISDDVQEQMNIARLAALKKMSRMRVQVGEESYPVLRLWRGGFSVEEQTAPLLRGLVDIYDGSRHMCQCLIIASESQAGERRYEFKRNTAAADKAPLDHYREPDAPAGLLPRD